MSQSEVYLLIFFCNNYVNSSGDVLVFSKYIFATDTTTVVFTFSMAEVLEKQYFMVCF